MYLVNDPHHISKEVLLQVANGDELLFTGLFHQYRNTIYSVAFKLTRSTTLAEEIVQDVFLKIWLKREKLAHVQDFASFLFIVARNEAYNCLRALAREELKGKKLESWMPASSTSSDTVLIEKELAGILQEAIARLPDRQREVYILSKEQGLKRDEIAARLQLSPQTVKAHLAQAVKSVRAYCIARLPMSIIILLMNKW